MCVQAGFAKPSPLDREKKKRKGDREKKSRDGGRDLEGREKREGRARREGREKRKGRERREVGRAAVWKVDVRGRRYQSIQQVSTR